MNKRPLTTIMTRFLRGASFLVLVFITINMIWLAQGQPQSSKNSQFSSQTSRSAAGAKGVVRVHDTTVRTQIATPQQNYGVVSSGAPSGVICGVESRAAHGQI